MKKQLQNGPVAAQVETSGDEWRNYNGGLITAETCTMNFNEYVLIVGYTDEYLIAKYWKGTSWGNSGYVYLSPNGNGGCGACGVLSQAYYLAY